MGDVQVVYGYALTSLNQNLKKTVVGSIASVALAEETLTQTVLERGRERTRKTRVHPFYLTCEVFLPWKVCFCIHCILQAP